MAESPPISRRQALKNAAALVGAAGMPGALAMAQVRSPAAAREQRLEKIGINLYTVQDRMAKSVPGTLKRIADIGYREVEFAGYFNHSAAEIRSMIDDAGLAAPSGHVPLELARTDTEQMIEYFVDAGHHYLVIPWISPDERPLLDDYRRHANTFNRIAEQCRSAGLEFAYHNHDFEFEVIDGIRPMDLLLDETDPDSVHIEFDLFWTLMGHVDPLDFFEAHPNRFRMCHVKDMSSDGSMVDVGAGTIDFAEIFAKRERAGLEHYYVAHDHPDDSMMTAANSYSALAELRFE